MNAHHHVDGEDIVVGESWANSVTQDLERSRRTAWIVASIAGAIALLLAIALVILMPLKQIEPYTLLVDRQTGNVEALTPLDEQLVAPDAALTRSHLAQYVIARESFDRANVQRDYQKTMLWSAGEERQRYGNRMASANPLSPFSQLPPGTSVSTEIASISNLSDSSAMVRFVTTRTDRTGRTLPPEHWAAIINYTFSGARMSESDRLINPLGFQVTRYRRDLETLPASQEGRLPLVPESETAS